MLTTTVTQSGPYTGNGSTTQFAVTFKFTDNAEVLVYTADAAGVMTLKTITTHYTVTGSGNATGGTVTFLTAPTSAQRVFIMRSTTKTQPTDFRNQGPWSAENTESTLDRAMRVAQEVNSLASRSIRIQPLDAAAGITTELATSPEAYQLVRINSTGTGFELADAGDVLSSISGIAVIGTGTVNYIPLWISATEQSDSIISQNVGATVATVTGNLQVTGTHTAGLLSVGGASTIGGTLDVTGATTMLTLTAGATLLASLDVTGLTSLGDDTDITGDLAVTGAIGAASLTLTTPLDETDGGTGTDTYATGDTLYASAANTLSKLPIGTAGQVLVVSGGGIPSWATSSSSGTNTGDVTLAGAYTYITIAGQVITRGQINLSTDVTGTLDSANIDQSLSIATLAISGAITQNADTDVNNVFGRVRIDNRSTDIAYFSHYDQSGNDSYAIAQNASGFTILNASTGQTIDFRINGVQVMNMGPTGLVVTGTVGATGAVTGSNLSGTHSGTSSGTNTGDQSSIVGISGTMAQFNTACSDGDFAFGGGTVTGTNTGDQTIILTGNVTGSGTGSFATTIAAGVVTNAMLAGSIDLTTKVTGVLPIANGGSNKALTLSAGGIIWCDADSFEVLSAGSSGQILRSGGATTPTWSTATYPATAGTASTFLRSNGTNIVNSVMTVPSGTGSTGQLWQGDGTGQVVWSTWDVPTGALSTNRFLYSSTTTRMVQTTNLTWDEATLGVTNQVTITTTGTTGIALTNSAAAANNKIWSISNPSGGISLNLYTDALVAKNVLNVTRSGGSPTEVAFNDDSVDCDFRVESDGNANMLFVDGGANRVSIGGNIPGYKLEVVTTVSAADGIHMSYATNITSEGFDLFYNNSGNTTCQIDSLYNNASAAINFRMRTAGTPLTWLSCTGGTTTVIGNASTDTITCTGRLLCRSVTDAGPMTATGGTQREIVYNTSNSKWYGCTVTHATAATWSAFN